MSHPGVDERVAALRADVTSGSSALAREAADILREAARRSDDTSVDELTASLTSLALQILEAQPSMAALVALVREVLAAIEPALALEAARARAADAAGSFSQRTAANAGAAGGRAAELIPTGRPVLTVSASSAVAAALLRAARGRPIGVFCLESRPMNEGRALAEELARAGADVTLAVDAAAESLVAGCGAVLLGADSIGDAGVVNKIGSAAAARAAAQHRVPVYVVADSSKLLPPGFPQCVDDDRPTDQVWPEPGPVCVWNRYFEVVPGTLISCVVLEDGSHAWPDLDQRRSTLTVPERLTEWAASHQEKPGGARAGHRT